MSAYVEHLERCWQDALAPRAASAPTVISTFAGGGGSSTGYHMAGYRELLAVEWDDHAAATLRLNWPHLPVHHGDIATLTVDEILQRTGLTPGQLDLFDGSPPCQGFSTSGRRQIDDPRNQLFREYVRLLQGLRPRVFVMENVTGMVKGKMKLIFAEVLQELRATGYDVQVRLLNASYLGVPQARERMIFIGVRDDLHLRPTFPTPTTRPTTVRQALTGLPDDPRGTLDGLALDIWRRLPPGRSFDELHPKGHWFGSTKLNPDKPAPTITKTVFGGGAAGLYHWRYPRLLNLAELKRLGSFPDAYRFPPGKDDTDTLTHAWARVGNSVPPLMMRAVALHIRQHILSQIPDSR